MDKNNVHKAQVYSDLQKVPTIKIKWNFFNMFRESKRPGRGHVPTLGKKMQYYVLPSRIPCISLIFILKVGQTLEWEMQTQYK